MVEWCVLPHSRFEILHPHPSLPQDILYYGNMTLGSPSQSVTVEIDTGSADLWVSTTRCVDCDSSKTSTSTSSKKQYDSAASSSYSDKRDAFHVGYGTGSVCGVLSADKVDINGFRVDGQDFGGVFKKTGVFTATPNNGLLGTFLRLVKATH